MHKWPTETRALDAKFQEGLAWEKLLVIHPKRADYRRNAAEAFAEVVRQGIVTGPWRTAHATNDAALSNAEEIIQAAEKHRALLP